MTIYYAHCMAIYNTPQETRDISLLKQLPLAVVVNPNNADTQRQCDQMREDGLGNDIMETIFKPMVLKCGVLAFRGLPDGRIPAGVMQEITWAESGGLLILELPTFAYDRKMSVGLTRQYLKEVGQR